METTSPHVELVHVLPFVLRPNDRLQDTLKNEFFIEPGSVEPRFLFKTMSSLAIEATRQHEQIVRKALFDIRQDLDTSAFELELSGQITGRRLETGDFRIYFGLSEVSKALLEHRRFEVASLLPDPKLVNEGPHGTMQLATTLPRDQIFKENQEIGEAGFNLKKALSKQQGKQTYITVSDGLVGRDGIHETVSYIPPQNKAT